MECDAEIIDYKSMEKLYWQKEIFYMKDVCVFIPCYNCDKYLEQTVNSLFNQSFQEFDIVIVDDGSTDTSYQIMKELTDRDSRVKVYRNEKNQGLGITRNLMFDYCKNYKYVALIDADDLAPENRLMIEYSYLQKHPEISCVVGVFQEINGKNELGKIRDIGGYSHGEMQRSLVFWNPINNSSAMFRMNDLRVNKIKYKENFFCAQDYMFYCELVQRCRIMKLPYILSYYRVHEENMTTISKKLRKKERDKLLDEIHSYMFKTSMIKMNPLERMIFMYGYRDTPLRSNLFKLIRLLTRIWYMEKHPEYKGLI